MGEWRNYGRRKRPEVLVSEAGSLLETRRRKTKEELTRFRGI